MTPLRSEEPPMCESMELSAETVLSVQIEGVDRVLWVGVGGGVAAGDGVGEVNWPVTAL
jgi:hypothetical protein